MEGTTQSSLDKQNGQRTRTSPEQLQFLEASFSTNPSPNVKVRENMARKIGMSERSIQIWFQNRRAKAKLAARKARIQIQEDALRKLNINPIYNTPVMIDSDRYKFGISRRHSLCSSDSSLFGPSSTQLTPDPSVLDSTNGFFPCTVLVIGSWQRMSIGSDKVECWFNTTSRMMSWIVGDQQSKFKLGFSFCQIIAISLSSDNSNQAILQFSLTSPPTPFIMQNNQFVQCTDFTEDQQASSVLLHSLYGDEAQFKTQLSILLKSAPDLSDKTSFLSGTGPVRNRALSVPQLSFNLSEPLHSFQDQHSLNHSPFMYDVNSLMRLHYPTPMIPESDIDPHSTLDSSLLFDNSITHPTQSTDLNNSMSPFFSG